ncbi:zinc-ribbon domain protein [Burkholderia sp. MSHR3999]|uniref:zinc ribbon domain-containing protein n=1 Tax=Burkholderia sp. MSHR3999 TaxID=1542965 RepID=UPI0005AC8047|nr:zinc ribbon domain-containing protein [Burkholderia sp. MSHR3999]KIP15221.1 zinc-ribbon domain protein [Burkholderia sp. MSHR3999]
MGFLKWITGGRAQRGHHGGGHGSGHHERGRDPHGWGWQTPAAGGAPLRQLACAGCGALNDAQARFCMQCGAAQQSAACRRCHAALAAGARFCPACGTQTA